MPSRSIDGRAIRKTEGVVSCMGRAMLPSGTDGEHHSDRRPRGPRARADAMGPRRARRRRRRRGRGAAPRRKRSRSRAAFAEEHRGKVQELDGEGLARAMRSLAEILELAARAGAYRGVALLHRHRRPRARRVARAGAGARDGARRRRSPSSSSSGRRCRRSARRSCSPAPNLDFCRHHLRNVRRYREHMLTEPEELVLTEKSLTGASAWSRLFEEQTSGARGPAARRGGAARRRAEPARLGRSRGPPQLPPRPSRRRSRPACARARYIMNTLLAGQGGGRSAAPLPAIGSRRATSPTR